MPPTPEGPQELLSGCVGPDKGLAAPQTVSLGAATAPGPDPAGASQVIAPGRAWRLGTLGSRRARGVSRARPPRGSNGTCRLEGQLPAWAAPSGLLRTALEPVVSPVTAPGLSCLACKVFVDDSMPGARADGGVSMRSRIWGSLAWFSWLCQGHWAQGPQRGWFSSCPECWLPSGRHRWVKNGRILG